MDDQFAKIVEIAAERGVALDSAYLDFLGALPIPFNDELKFDGRSWCPYTLESLLKPTRIGLGAVVPRALEARAYADFISESANLPGDSGVARLEECGFCIERLRRSFTVGCFNGDPIFVDAESGGVFIYYHDGGDVEKVASSLKSLVAGSTID